MQAILYDLAAFDPATYAVAAAAVLLRAGLAGLMPAWRASRVNPMEALRTD